MLSFLTGVRRGVQSDPFENQHGVKKIKNEMTSLNIASAYAAHHIDCVYIYIANYCVFCSIIAWEDQTGRN
jgi:hypothetical protein